MTKKCPETVSRIYTLWSIIWPRYLVTLWSYFHHKSVVVCHVGATFTTQVVGCHVGARFTTRVVGCHVGARFTTRVVGCHVGAKFTTRVVGCHVGAKFTTRVGVACGSQVHHKSGGLLCGR